MVPPPAAESMMPNHRTILVAALLAALAPAQNAVSPIDRAALEGSSFTHFPLGRASARMVTLHRDLPGGTVLNGHAYRRDAIALRGQVDAFQCDLEVRIAMSPLTPTTASATFANNLGAGAVTVLPRRVLAFPATVRPTLDPSPTFDLQVPYQTPFVVPAAGGTVCVEVLVYGNQSVAGGNQNLSLYLDAHEHYSDGRSEQPGFRLLTGCAAPGSTTPSTATLSFWRLPTGSRLDVALRDGVPDDGSGATRAFLLMGTQAGTGAWPTLPGCGFWSSSEVWYALPGLVGSNGAYDGALLGLPQLPPGFRLWCQAGSVNLLTGDLAFTDASTFVTPPTGPLPIPTARVVNSTNVSAATGTVSFAVPVMAFW
jgi:hypothetical protein